MHITDDIVTGLLENREQALEREMRTLAADLRAKGVEETAIDEILSLRRREHVEFTAKLRRALDKLKKRGR